MNSQDYMLLEETYAAHTYHPLEVVVDRADGVWVYDVEGKKYLDCLSAYSAVNQGHCHPRILAAAAELQKQLIAVIEGQPPYDIFVRWKPLHKQPIGWEPDINDGVRMNIRPFLTASLANGRTGAGILRWKPNIKWGKDRGTEPQRPKNEYPWFWGWDENTVDFKGGPEFKGERFNACHYTLQAKQHAREAARSTNDK